MRKQSKLQSHTHENQVQQQLKSLKTKQDKRNKISDKKHKTWDKKHKISYTKHKLSKHMLSKHMLSKHKTWNEKHNISDTNHEKHEKDMQLLGHHMQGLRTDTRDKSVDTK